MLGIILLSYDFPILPPFRILSKFKFPPALLQGDPHRQRHQSLSFLSNQGHLHRIEAMIQEHYQRRLLLQIEVHYTFFQARLEDLLKESSKLCWILLECLPDLHPLPELLVHHDNDGHGVRPCGALRIVIRPEKVLQILAELQHHDPSDRELGRAYFLHVNVIHYLGIKRQVLVGGVRRPVLIRKLQHNEIAM